MLKNKQTGEMLESVYSLGIKWDLCECMKYMKTNSGKI